ncbi:MAG: hypothetical protein R3F05_19035 [Planctomycetota bacterium]
MAFWGILLAMLAVLLAPRLGLGWRPAKALLVAAVLLLATSMWAPVLISRTIYNEPDTFLWVMCGTEWLGTLVLFLAFLRFRNLLHPDEVAAPHTRTK